MLLFYFNLLILVSRSGQIQAFKYVYIESESSHSARIVLFRVRGENRHMRYDENTTLRLSLCSCSLIPALAGWLAYSLTHKCMHIGTYVKPKFIEYDVGALNSVWRTLLSLSITIIAIVTVLRGEFEQH